MALKILLKQARLLVPIQNISMGFRLYVKGSLAQEVSVWAAVSESSKAPAASREAVAALSFAACIHTTSKDCVNVVAQIRTRKAQLTRTRDLSDYCSNVWTKHEWTGISRYVHRYPSKFWSEALWRCQTEAAITNIPQAFRISHLVLRVAAASDSCKGWSW